MLSFQSLALVRVTEMSHISLTDPSIEKLWLCHFQPQSSFIFSSKTISQYFTSQIKRWGEGFAMLHQGIFLSSSTYFLSFLMKKTNWVFSVSLHGSFSIPFILSSRSSPSPSPWTFSLSCRYPTTGSMPLHEFPSLVRYLSNFSQLSWTLPKFTSPCHLQDLPLCSSPSFLMSSKDIGPFACHFKYCYCFHLQCVTSTL